MNFDFPKNNSLYGDMQKIQGHTDPTKRKDWSSRRLTDRYADLVLLTISREMKEKYVSDSCKLPLMHLKDFFPAFLGKKSAHFTSRRESVVGDDSCLGKWGKKPLFRERELFILHHIFSARVGGEKPGAGNK